MKKRVAHMGNIAAARKNKPPRSQQQGMRSSSFFSSKKTLEGMVANESTPKTWWPEYIELVRTGLAYDLSRYTSTDDPIEELSYIRGQLLSAATLLRDAAQRVGASSTTDLEIFWWRTKGAELAAALAGVITDANNSTVNAVETAVNTIRSTYSRAGGLVVPAQLTGESASKTNTAITNATNAINAAAAVAVYPEQAYEDYLLALKLAFDAHLRATIAAAMDNRVERQYWEQVTFAWAEEMYAHATSGSVELDAELVYWFKMQELEKMILPLFDAVAADNKTVAEWRTIIGNLASAANTAALKTGFSPSLVTAVAVRTQDYATLKTRVDTKRTEADRVIRAAPARAALVALLGVIRQEWAGELVSTAQLTSAARIAGWVEKATVDAGYLVTLVIARGQPSGANAAETLWWMFCAVEAAEAMVDQAKLPSDTESNWRSAINAWQLDIGNWLKNGYVTEASPRSYSALQTKLTALQADILTLTTGTPPPNTPPPNTPPPNTPPPNTPPPSGSGGTPSEEELKKIREKEEVDAHTADRKRAFEQSAAQRREAEWSVWRMLAFGGAALFLCALGAFVFGILAFWAVLAVVVTIGFGYAALERYQKIRDRDPGAFSQVNPDKLDKSPKPTPHVEASGSSSSFTTSSSSSSSSSSSQQQQRRVGGAPQSFSSGEGFRTTTARTSGAGLAQETDAKRRRVTRPAVMAVPRASLAPVSAAGFRASSSGSSPVDNACGCAAAATVGNTRKTWIGDGW